MTALYLRFCGSPEQDPEAEDLARQLRERLDKEQRRTLLKLIDRYNSYCEAQAEAAFIAGIAMELCGGWYSFEEEEERRGSECIPRTEIEGREK